METRTSARRRWSWAVIAAWDVVCLAVSAWAAMRAVDELHEAAEAAPPARRRDRDRDRDREHDAEGNLLWPKDRQYVVDPVVGHHPRPNHDGRLRLGPLGGEPLVTSRHSNNLGLIRVADVVGLPAPPRVLLVGDSHLMGVVTNAANASDVLEVALRREPDLATATVLNGSAGYYSLWQLVLRATSLEPTLAPDLVVLAVFLGNDFVELEDVGRPHLDDALVPQPARADPPAERTSERQQRLGDGGRSPLFWQGLNQAAYFAERPERLEPVIAKARGCIERADEVARAASCRLLVALVPSYDLVFPERVAPFGEPSVAATRAGANETLRAALKEQLAARAIPCVDPTDAFRRDGRDALYASDYHLHVEGHRLLAEALLAPVRAALPPDSAAQDR